MAENLTTLEQKNNIYKDLVTQYILHREPALISKIEIAADEAKAMAILSSRNQKLMLLTKLQKIDGLLKNIYQLDERMGITYNDGLMGEMKKAKTDIVLNSIELRKLAQNEMASASNWGYAWLWLVFLLLLGSIALLYINLEKYIHVPFKIIIDFLAQLVKGKLPEKLKFKKSDEVADMGNHLNKVVEGLQIKADFAIEIGKGKLDSRYKPLSQDDILGNALIEMEKSLQKADFEDQKYKNEEKKRIWANEGLAKFGEILRLHNNDISKLSDEIIQNMVKYLNAAQGGLYFFNDDDKSDVFLELVAAFAFDRKKFQKQKIALGEGLVGTVAIEKMRQFLTEIPEDFLNISSGLGDAPPRSILIVPLKLEDEVLGVVELASFNIFEKHEIEFVEKIGETIAATITNVKINARTSILLEQSQKQAEEMAEQEEEMRQNMEELRTTQEDFGRRETEIQGFLDAVQTSTMIFVIDDSGRIIDANKSFLDTLHSSYDDIVGRFHREFTSLGKVPEQFDAFWDDLKSGRQKNTIEKIRLSTGKDIFLKQTFSPILDKKNNLIKVICVSTDVTDVKNFEKQLETKDKDLKKISKDFTAVSSAIDLALIRCEYSIEGRIVDVNENYCKITGHGRAELIGKINTIFFKEDEKAQFDKIWNEVIKDKTYSGSIKRSKPTGEEIWLMSSFAPAKDEDGNITKVYFLALDITERKLKYQLLEEANKEIDRLRKKKADD